MINVLYGYTFMVAGWALSAKNYNELSLIAFIASLVFFVMNWVKKE